MCGQCWDQLGLAFSSDTVCLSQYRPEQKLDKQEGFTVHDTSLISNSGEQIETDLKIESCVFSSGAFSACLVRQISPSSASILSQSRTGGHPAHFQNIVNQSISENANASENNESSLCTLLVNMYHNTPSFQHNGLPMATLYCLRVRAADFEHLII